MQLPPPIAAYFEAETADDGDALVAQFAENAIVNDEATGHEGHAAIRAWWASAKAKYHQTIEPLEIFSHGNVATVHCKVSGNFPGSPITLAFRFTLAGDTIVKLEIR